MDKGKKSVGILTFHASHNYGSCLQAYALLKTVKKLGVNAEIINFRTDRQKDMYAVFTKRKGVKYFFKNLTHLFYYFPLRKKHEKFEKFINEEYELSKEQYKTIAELENADFAYDSFIVGSDQIWNPIPKDFDWAYFLTFTESKKIAYAPSFGPFFGRADEKLLHSIADQIEKFSFVSVREYNAKNYLSKYTQKQIEVVLDPTLLVDKEEWMQLVENEPSVEGEYIFLYTLFSSAEINKIAKELAQKWKMKVVVSNFSNQYDVFTPYTKKFDAGPKDFLNLIYHAKFVLVTSFHGTVFSILFEKPFFAINGGKDNRISTLLTHTKLSERTIEIDNIDAKAETAFSIDFKVAKEELLKEREHSIEYLRMSLES